MGNRLSRIYTRTGDNGTTGLGDGSRVEKDSLRVETFGTIDELNSHIGVVLSLSLPDKVRSCLAKVQHELFDLGGELCLPGQMMVLEPWVTRLEKELDEFNDELPALKEFILPGGSADAAACHVARTVCRRAERRLVELAGEEAVNPVTLGYLNRLSDLLFVIARTLARASGGKEILWQHQSGR